MRQPAAKEADVIVATDTHLASGSPVEVPFRGKLDGNLSRNVLMEPARKCAAMVDSTATNDPPHVPPSGKTFDKPLSNQAVVAMNGNSVWINNRRAARNGDKAKTCNDPKDLEEGRVVAGGKVFIGR